MKSSGGLGAAPVAAGACSTSSDAPSAATCRCATAARSGGSARARPRGCDQPPPGALLARCLVAARAECNDGWQCTTGRAAPLAALPAAGAAPAVSLILL
jgi:hypothetical protein